ncbi:hypothetical protein T492DRAFT_888621 [Pavlovales sp. CCMP2436]|nr:hypothetical protein T492DRAFT_888621 [Pavlovales sp. CCMP2436]
MTIPRIGLTVLSLASIGPMLAFGPFRRGPGIADDSAVVPVEGLTLEARLLRGAASGQLNKATSHGFGHSGDPVKLEKACAAMAEAHARFARDPTAHAFRKLLGRTARIALTGHFFSAEAREAPHLSVDERSIYMAWSVSSDQRERMRSVDEPTAREARQLFAFLARAVQMPMLNTNLVMRLRAQDIAKLARGTSTAGS